MIKRGSVEIGSEKYVKWLSELSKASGNIAGGKGANLAEMYNSKFPVPPAFCVTAQAFDEFLKKAGLKDEIKKIIASTNVDDTQELEVNSKKIRELITNSEMPEDMQAELIESYELLSTDASFKKAEATAGISKNALDILKHSKELAFVAVRSSATTEDLATASFAGQQETYTNIRGNKELILAVKKCFASLFTARAVYYRHKKGFDKANALLSVVVQRMINSDKSGVIFTKNPMTGDNEIIIEAVWGLGEGIVSGKILPDHYVLSPNLDVKDKKISNKKIEILRAGDGTEKTINLSPEKSKHQVLTAAEISILGDLASKLEEHYKKPQDIEFAVENGEVFIVQTRPITTLENIKEKSKELEGNAILTGMPASPGVASGIVKVIRTMEDLQKIKSGDVLVTKMTNPDMVVSMQKAVAIITDEGGATAHAAIVSREMGIACVVGTEHATQKLKDGDIVTVDGTHGKIYEGKAQEIQGLEKEGKKEILPIVKTKTHIKVMVDLPDFAERAAKTGLDSVGLVRLEGIIAEGGKHPMLFEKQNNPEKYTEIIHRGIAKIAHYFKEMWIRTSDIRSDEYQNLEGAPKEIEVNPMLGMHGIRFSLKHPLLFEAEIEAIRRVAEKYPEKKFGLMFPQVISEEEMAEAFKIFKKFKRDNMIIGAMIETPAACQVIRGICKYAKFISFGTNDLTQFTLAIDRGNSEVQYLYNEMHPAVLSQLRRVIDICKEYHVQTSICGQAGSKKEMVEFLVKQGIDSLSVNADMAHDISVFVKELEDSGIARNKNPNSNHNSNNNHNNNMVNSNNNNQNNHKPKILPIDDMSEVKEIGEKRQEQNLKHKVRMENSNKDTMEVKEDKKEEKQKETPEQKQENKENKSEEFPEFEIGFDPFQEQK